MNSCILMAKIVRRPELRYTQDNQTPYAQMLVEFDSFRSDEPPATLRVVAWRNLATEVAEKFNEGEQVIIEGRLSMQMTERPEGFKEKRAELVVSHIYSFQDMASTLVSMSTPNEAKVVSMNSFKQKQSEPEPLEDEIEEPSYESPQPQPSLKPVSASVDQDLDDIPF